jgi:HlyD family secretion protein
MTREIKTIQPELPSTVERPEVPALGTRDLVPAPAHADLPATRPARKAMAVRRRWLRVAVVLAVVAGAAGAALYWWQHSRSQLPPGIVWSNGRIEADEIDIDTKFAGRIAEILANEGDMVKAGHVVARMDTRDLAASLKTSDAQVQQARKAIEEANANVVQQTSQVLLAQQEFDRATYLVQRGAQTKDVQDRVSSNWTAPMPP